MDLQVLDNHIHEIQVVIRDYNARCTGKQGAELLALRREMNRAIVDLLGDQARAMAFMAGEKIEPKTVFAEAIIVGEGGIGP